MSNKEITEHLFNEFKKDFDINHHVNLNDINSQPFEFGCSYEFQQDKGWKEATINVIGVIYIKSGKDEYQNPLGHGAAENVGEPNSIEDYDFLEIELFIDGKSITTTKHLKQLVKHLEQ